MAEAYGGEIPTDSLSERPKLLRELKVGLKRLYGARLAEVILFGSQARGDADNDSDVDVLVVLTGAVNPGAEIRYSGPLLAALSLEFETLISPVFLSADDFARRQGGLLRNIRREGVPL
jgi:predicted nucleotidyltransferase